MHMQIQMQVHGVSLTLILYLEQRELEDALLEAGYPLSTEQANPNPNAIPNPSPNLNPNLNPNPSPNPNLNPNLNPSLNRALASA